ncbi:unnamed protein product [Tilletia controversa]|uniref:Uncharacterized protein n=2 Tax=Tilletia TaxID=13289 RepID=A0A8X7SXB1_9BASI|nr:hypothetical protein A4X06_0g3555 [Tilletia controversa]KAE8263265.1 hypothetical protein A4X03_0g1805 [Tilletia caries]CAD6915889.1 unnamed protein product [Tilletia controversa]
MRISLPFAAQRTATSPRLLRIHPQTTQPQHKTQSTMPSGYRDPWAAREAWRKHPLFTNRFYIRNMFPGLGLGAAAFGVYLAVDMLTHPSNLDKIREDAHRQLANQGTILKGH